MLAILTTHPIQYQVPIWRALAERGRIPSKVFFMSDQGVANRHDPGFGRALSWDIDLLNGYDHQFITTRTGERQDSFWWLRLDDSFKALLAQHGAKVLWIQGWQVAAYWQAIWQAHAAGLTTWLRGETNLRSTGQGWGRAVKDMALGSLLARIDRFLCIGSANRAFYLSRGIAEQRLASAPYCVDNTRFATAASALRARRAELRHSFGIPPDAFCLLFVGKMIDKKRPLDLVEAARRVQARHPGRKLHLLFVGTGALMEAVQSRCAGTDDVTDHQRGPGATFAGFLNQSRIAEAYVAADCLALPSEGTETWGLVVNEAMASGTPAIVSAACGCSDDLVRPHRPDLCFPLGDIEAFADCIAACMARPPSQQDIAAVIARYDVMRTVEAVEQLYARGRYHRTGAVVGHSAQP